MNLLCLHRAATSACLYLIIAAAGVTAEEPAIGKIQFIQLEHASAPEVVGLLTPFFHPDSLILRADPRTNMLIAKGSEREMDEVRSSIHVLDAPETERPKGDAEVRVFSLVQVRASSLAESLASLLDDSSIRLVPDVDSNTILARGRANDLKVVEAILLKLDSTQRVRTPKKVAARHPPVGLAQVKSILRASQTDGSVRLEAVSGTDNTFIIRGRKEDVQRAMKIIRNSEETKSNAKKSVLQEVKKN